MDNIVNLTEELRELDIKLCFICQKRKKDKNRKYISLSNLNGEGISKLINAAEKRKEHGDISDISKRIAVYLQNDSEIDISLLKYHRCCYGNFTQPSKIDRLIKEKSEKVNDKKSDIATPYGGTTRSKVSALDWNLCIFCQKNSNIRLSSITEMAISKYIMTNAKLNLKVFIALSNVSDLIAAEAKYHLNCYSDFKRLKQRTEKEEKNIDYALLYVLEELNKAESKGDVVRLNDVWERYVEHAENYNTNLTRSYKDKHTFGICLKNKLEKGKSSYQFFTKLNDNETIMFPVNYLKEGISSIINHNDKELEESIIPKHRSENNDEFLALVHVALRLRGDINQKEGYKGLSITNEASEGCIPESLYLFLSLLFGGLDLLNIGENEYFKRGKWKEKVKMSIAQDIIFGLSNGKKWTPKHIGLTSTLHQKLDRKIL